MTFAFWQLLKKSGEHQQDLHVLFVGLGYPAQNLNKLWTSFLVSIMAYKHRSYLTAVGLQQCSIQLPTVFKLFVTIMPSRTCLTLEERYAIITMTADVKSKSMQAGIIGRLHYACVDIKADQLQNAISSLKHAYNSLGFSIS